MVKKTKNDQIFTINRQDDIRKELDGKIDNLNDKVGKKVSNQLFISTVAALGIVGGSIFSYAFIQMSELSNKLEELNKNVTIIQVKADEKNNLK